MVLDIVLHVGPVEQRPLGVLPVKEGVYVVWMFLLVEEKIVRLCDLREALLLACGQRGTALQAELTQGAV